MQTFFLFYLSTFLQLPVLYHLNLTQSYIAQSILQLYQFTPLHQVIFYQTCLCNSQQSWGGKRYEVIYLDLWGMTAEPMDSQVGWHEGKQEMKQLRDCPKNTRDRGCPEKEGEGQESGRVGEQIDWKTHLLRDWHSTAHKSSLAWRTIWNQNRLSSKWRTTTGMEWNENVTELTSWGGNYTLSERIFMWLFDI